MAGDWQVGVQINWGLREVKQALVFGCIGELFVGSG